MQSEHWWIYYLAGAIILVLGILWVGAVIMERSFVG